MQRTWTYRSKRQHRFPHRRQFLHLLFWSVCLLAFSATSCRSGCASSTMPYVTLYPPNGASVQVSVEIADTPGKRSFGLMYRRDLPEHQGMLFLFPREAPLSFWMKNTPLPLDIIYINAARTIVSIAANTTPFSERPLPSGSPAQFVLEVNAGFCHKYGITTGARVELPSRLPPPS